MATLGTVQLDITINGKSVTITKDHAVSLKVTRLIGDSADQFTLEVFDETAYQLESALMAQKLASIAVRYSVSTENNKKSILFSGTCYNYELTFAGRATMLSITGILASSTGIENGYWFDTRAVQWVGDIDYYTDSSTGVKIPYAIDGKSLEEAAQFENNEDVCAFIDYPKVLDEEGNEVLSSIPVAYYNPSRIFKRIIHAYNGDKLGSTVAVSTTRNSADSSLQHFFGTVGTEAIEVAKKTWNYLTSTNGYNMWVAAGIMGNMIQESSMNPRAKNNINGGHYGLCQWSKIYYPSMWEATLDQQLAFIDGWIRGEYNSFKNNYTGVRPILDVNGFFNLKDAEKAAEAFALVMERAGRNEAYIEKRKSYATMVLKYFNGGYDVTETYYSNSSITIDGWGTGGENGFILGEVEESKWIADLPVLQQPNETAAQYITNTLCKYAVSDTGKAYKDETAGFQYIIKDGKHCFIPLDYGKEVSSANTIEVSYGMQNSEVISFSIAKVGVLAMMGNNATKDQIADATSMDDLTADPIREGGENIFGNESTSKDLDDSSEYLNWYEGITKKSFKGVRVSSSSSETRLSSSLSSYWNDLENYSFSAELTVWSDASNKYVPGKYINILVRGAEGIKHYASGIYYITKVEDSVSVDGYTQTLRLLKYPDTKHNYVSSDSNEDKVFSKQRDIHDKDGNVINTVSTVKDTYTGGGGSSGGSGVSGSFGGRWPEEVELDNV